MKGVESECMKLKTPSNVREWSRASAEGVECVQGAKNVSKSYLKGWKQVKVNVLVKNAF